MGFQAAIAKKNRSNNSGGIAPEPLHTVNTLSIVIHYFKAMFTCTKDIIEAHEQLGLPCRR